MKKEILKYIGNFIPENIVIEKLNETLFDFSGSKAAKFLELYGFEIVGHGCGPRNAYAITADGYKLSSNGYFCKTI